MYMRLLVPFALALVAVAALVGVKAVMKDAYVPASLYVKAWNDTVELLWGMPPTGWRTAYNITPGANYTFYKAVYMHFHGGSYVFYVSWRGVNLGTYIARGWDSNNPSILEVRDGYIFVSNGKAYRVYSPMPGVEIYPVGVNSTRWVVRGVDFIGLWADKIYIAFP